MAVTYRSDCNSRVADFVRNDFVTFLRGFRVCVWRETRVQTSCREAVARTLAAVFVGCPNSCKGSCCSSFQSRGRHRNTGERAGEALEACASLLVSVVLSLKS